MSHTRYTEHHHPPKSRGGTKTVELPENFHDAWHTLFENLKGKELLKFIVRIHQLMDRQDKITSKEIYDLQQEVKEDG
mgnify:CR=1 FL=1